MTDIPDTGVKLQLIFRAGETMDPMVPAGSYAQKKGNPLTAKMQPAGLNLYPLPQGRLHKSTLNELWQDQGDHIVAVDGPVRQFNGGWQSVTCSVCRS